MRSRARRRADRHDGRAGAQIHTDGATLDIPSRRGRGRRSDGLRRRLSRGLLYGIVHGWDWQRSGRLASTLGALKIASRGGQNHAISRDSIAAAYHEAFDAHLW
jgi:adenosine kinase